MEVDYSPDPNIRYKTYTNMKHMQLASTAYRYAKQKSVMVKYIRDLKELIGESNEKTLMLITASYDQEIAKLTDAGFKLSEEEAELNKQLETVKLEQELRDIRLSNLELLSELGRKRANENVIVRSQVMQVSDSSNTNNTRHD